MEFYFKDFLPRIEFDWLVEQTFDFVGSLSRNFPLESVDWIDEFFGQLGLKTFDLAAWLWIGWVLI